MLNLQSKFKSPDRFFPFNCIHPHSLNWTRLVFESILSDFANNYAKDDEDELSLSSSSK